MKRIVMVTGAPNAPAAYLLKAFEQAGAAVAVGYDLWSMLQRLRDGTQHRAMAWQGVHAKPADWIDPAVARLAQVFLEAFAMRVRQARSNPDALLAVWSPNVGPHCEELAGMLPGVRWIHLLESGVSARADSESAGFDWAETWSRAVAAGSALAAKLGERLHTVRAEELVRDPRSALQATFAWLDGSAPPPANFAPAALSAGPRLAGRALVGFAAHPRAERWMRELQYELPRDAAAQAAPQTSARRARVWIELGDSERAEQELARRAPGAERSVVLGRLRSKQGRADEAATAYLHALELDETASEAFVALFDAARPEALRLAPFARTHADVLVRSALARWLVARGLDAEAAEIVASVENTGWR